MPYKESKKRREAHRLFKENRRKNNPEKVILESARMRARRDGIDFDLTLEDIVIPNICPVLGIPLYNSLGRWSANSPSLDRRDNTIGYVKGNVFVISHRANRLKSDATVAELQALADYASGKMNA